MKRSISIAMLGIAVGLTSLASSLALQDGDKDKKADSPKQSDVQSTKKKHDAKQHIVPGTDPKPTPTPRHKGKSDLSDTKKASDKK